MASSTSQASAKRQADEPAELGPDTKRLNLEKTSTNRRPLCEPPIFSYSESEAYDEVQKKAKDIDGEILEWKTDVLDLHMGKSLLLEYRDWVELRRECLTGSDGQQKRRFYAGLHESLTTDLGEVFDKEVKNMWSGEGKWKLKNWEFGRVERDLREILDARWREKRGGASWKVHSPNRKCEGCKSKLDISPWLKSTVEMVVEPMASKVETNYEDGNSAL